MIFYLEKIKANDFRQKEGKITHAHNSSFQFKNFTIQFNGWVWVCCVLRKWYVRVLHFYVSCLFIHILSYTYYKGVDFVLQIIMSGNHDGKATNSKNPMK